MRSRKLAVTCVATAGVVWCSAGSFVGCSDDDSSSGTISGYGGSGGPGGSGGSPGGNGSGSTNAGGETGGAPGGGGENAGGTGGPAQECTGTEIVCGSSCCTGGKICDGKACIDRPILTLGSSHTCAVSPSGKPKCWGTNDLGQLGDGTKNNRSIPTEIQGISSGVEYLSTHDGHTCAILTGGSVMCWGANYDGQLGPGTTNNTEQSPIPVQGLPATGIVAIAPSCNHTCAIYSEGDVYCWGANYRGQLGIGSPSSIEGPTKVQGLSQPAIAIAAGCEDTCVITSDKRVSCWGFNWRGELGVGTTEQSPIAVPVSNLDYDIVAISLGDASACALSASGDVYCWGANDRGQLGTGYTTDRPRPTLVTDLPAGTKEIAVGWEHACALTSSGGVMCWGANDYGQLGTGNTASAIVPVQISQLSSGVLTIASGGVHTCAIITGGAMRCWGLNEDGGLGDGTNENRTLPVAVVGFPWE